MSQTLYGLPRGVMTIAKESSATSCAARSSRGPSPGTPAWPLVLCAPRRHQHLGAPGGTSSGARPARLLSPRARREAGVVTSTFERVTGVFSRADRDPRFHAVTVVVRCRIEPPVRAPRNRLEIREARLFAPDALPDMPAMGAREMLDSALVDGPVTFE